MPERTRLIDRALFADESGSTLRGSACDRCGATTFPAQDGCPRCGSDAMTVTALPATGRLWSFTVQNFEPKPPYRGRSPFAPYGVGYIDLGPVIVESRLTVNDPAALHIGQRMQLTTVEAYDDEDGTAVLTYAFDPAADDNDEEIAS
jgi:uncharacterized protein